MSHKSEAAYRALFSYVRYTLCPQMDPRRIVTDYETSLQNALRQAFPAAVCSGCWFHYTQALFRNAKRRGLHQLLQNDPNAWKVISMAMALPLLPSNQIAAGFQNVRNFALQHNLANAMGPWLDYVQTQWLTNVGADVISVHMQRHRTTNCVESFHNRLRLWFNNIAHPNIWFFTDKLRQVEMSSSLDMDRLDRGLDIRRSRNRRYVLQDERIRRATQRLANNLIDVGQFLNIASYLAGTVDRFLAMNLQDDDDVG
ncbi:hypothetical protein B566_EDAN007038, partial [Ephemera danica]